MTVNNIQKVPRMARNAVATSSVGQKLQRDMPRERPVGSAIDHAHAACAEHVDDFVCADSRSGTHGTLHLSYQVLRSRTAPDDTR